MGPRQVTGPLTRHRPRRQDTDLKQEKCTTQRGCTRQEEITAARPPASDRLMPSGVGAVRRPCEARIPLNTPNQPKILTLPPRQDTDLKQEKCTTQRDCTRQEETTAARPPASDRLMPSGIGAVPRPSGASIPLNTPNQPKILTLPPRPSDKVPRQDTDLTQEKCTTQRGCTRQKETTAARPPSSDRLMTSDHPRPESMVRDTSLVAEAFNRRLLESCTLPGHFQLPLEKFIQLTLMLYEVLSHVFLFLESFFAGVRPFDCPRLTQNPPPVGSIPL